MPFKACCLIVLNSSSLEVLSNLSGQLLHSIKPPPPLISGCLSSFINSSWASLKSFLLLASQEPVGGVGSSGFLGGIDLSGFLSSGLSGFFSSIPKS
jgi:hypothetical protein